MGKDIVFGEDWFIMLFVIYGLGVVLFVWVIILLLMLFDVWDIL